MSDPTTPGSAACGAYVEVFGPDGSGIDVYCQTAADTCVVDHESPMPAFDHVANRQITATVVWERADD